MNSRCASNVAAYWCRTNFRQCQLVGDMWVPSLMCRSECEQHWESWSECLDALKADPDARASFDRQMVELADTSALGARILFGLGP